MTTRVTIEVLPNADYKVETVCCFANGSAGFEWTRAYLRPGETSSIYIHSALYIDSIKEVPLDTPET